MWKTPLESLFAPDGCIAMSKFKLPSTKSYREYIDSSDLTKQEKEALLKVLDYSAAHPSSLADKQAQTKRAEIARREIAEMDF